MTDWGEKQVAPRQKMLPPSPLHSQTWQHFGSMLYIVAGLQSQQENKQQAEWKPPEKIEKQLSQRQSQAMHWHIISLSDIDYIIE